MMRFHVPLAVDRAARVSGLWPAAALVVCLAGCGDNIKPYSGPVYPVTGKVLLADGKPLKGGRIVFLPKELGAMPATGEIGSDGAFSLKAADGRDGAAPGDYKVKIEPDASMLVKKGKTKVPPFPPIYMEEDGDTGLTATVKAETTPLEPFKLVPPAAPVSTSRGRE